MTGETLPRGSDAHRHGAARNVARLTTLRSDIFLTMSSVYQAVHCARHKAARIMLMLRVNSSVSRATALMVLLHVGSKGVVVIE